MKVTREYPEYKFKKITIELETEKDVLNLYRLTGDGMYDFLRDKFSKEIADDINDNNIVSFKSILHDKLEDSVPVELRQR